MQTYDKQWNHVHQTRNWGKYPAEEVVRFMARNYGNQNHPTVKVLDLGCGTGANTWFLCREGFLVFAFDGAFAALIKARQLCQTEQTEASFLQADAGFLPFADSSFDVSLDVGAIAANTTAGIRKILKEIWRTLRPGGKFFSTVLFSQSTTGYKTGEKIDSHSFRNVANGPVAGLGTIHFFNRAHIKSLWQEAGFSNLVMDKMSRTDHNGEFKVSYYMVTADKPVSYKP